MTLRERAMRLEMHTIQPIAATARHGRARDLFTVWFGANLMLLTIVTGALAVTVFHLPFVAATLCIVAGNLLGAIFMALHAAQGPTLGVPQMVQTRGQFGSLGSLLVVGLVVVMYIGFVASNLVLGGEALHATLPSVGETPGIVIIGVLGVVGAILGYDLIHAYARFITYSTGVVMLGAFAWIVLVHGLPADFLLRNQTSAVGICGAISIAALWQIAYAPYVSDYSRYMPAQTGARAAFWATYWGCALGSIVPMILGIVAGLCATDDDAVRALAALTHGIAPLVLLMFCLGMVEANAMNLYCGALSVLTFGQTLVPGWSPRGAARTTVSIVLFVLAVAMALLGKDSFLASYTSFILLLLYVLVPWTAINLVDYYLVQRGRYDVASFFRADGGIYGRINLEAVCCYLGGIIVQVPFMSTPLYTGRVAALLGGADLSWLVGLGVTAPVYYFAARAAGSRRRRSSSRAPVSPFPT